jgi:hypothetical protein
LANRKKIVRDQRGATDQATVDISLAELNFSYQPN